MSTPLIRRGCRGFTFIETIIVIGIILVLTGSVGFTAIGFLDRARLAAARSQIEIYSAALQAYYLDTGRLPTAEQGLHALWEYPYLEPRPTGWMGPYLDRPAGPDPWGEPYRYQVPGPDGRPFAVSSTGVQP
ncbi:type II secretion system major pseudopilin GspG [Spirochaeta africana]|uniref:General secretion pathway protein G n=1 Tax=Spirochaeta africana (strain ATCC 700263 / DSM 8902 / Z-7692) TaxID=889378 RepID=H9UK48_SPIAZ|nr:type II secretion system major pseudopilin GspG [Spirochaeta africana]AFG37891.1 general secretion pathway protein G [Spirochaeta africana DSM 8902]